jgi:hypothetical protein
VTLSFSYVSQRCSVGDFPSTGLTSMPVIVTPVRPAVNLRNKSFRVALNRATRDVIPFGD